MRFDRTTWGHTGRLVLLLALVSCGSGNDGTDPCDPNPCSLFGRTVCRAEGDEARCLCDPGFEEDADGRCVPTTSQCDPACADGERCEDGVCVEDTCDPDCGAGQRCERGACVENVCNPPCPSGETCVAEEPRACACGTGEGCADGWSCVEGECVEGVGPCEDEADNDGDGWTDDDDPDCVSGDEVGLGTTGCNDGDDDDGDDLVDAADPDCESALDDEGGAGCVCGRASLAASLLSPDCQGIAIISHMGAWGGEIPGNSMAAYRRAYDLGAHGIEADVQVSRDGVPFMIHDDEIQAYQSLICMGRVISESDASDIDGCLLVPSLTETIPSFDEFVEWARGKMLIHLDVKNTDDLAVMVQQVIDYDAEDFVFAAVSVGEATTTLPTLPGWEGVYFLLRVGSVADIDTALGALALPNIFMLEGDRAWSDPPVDETAMMAQVERVHAGGRRIMASSDTYTPTVDDHRRLIEMGFDAILSYNCANGVEAGSEADVARGCTW